MFKFTLAEKILFLFFFIFSIFIMWKTFSVSAGGDIHMASKVWSDFAATIPLMRSFSLGNNFPPEYPIFAGPNIRYHFIYYFLVGSLEKIGLPLDWALNLPSAIGFTLLLTEIYLVARTIFKSRAVGILAIMLFLFNGSFSFLEFFKSHPISISTLVDIVKNTAFPSFGPYDGKVVSAFWNLNIYTNQRHLALSYAAFLAVLLALYFFSENFKKLSNKNAVLFGVLVGLFPFVHYAVFGMMEMTILLACLIYPKIRLKTLVIILVSLIVATPQILYMGVSEVPTKLLKIGYLLSDFTVYEFVRYWFLNLGLTSLLALLGFMFSDKRQRKIFLIFLSFFVVGNVFQFSSEIAANHKFFNLFMIGANMFSAFYLVKIWQGNLSGKLVSITLFPLLVLSGIIDFFPIVNDNHITLEDLPKNKVALFIRDNTPKGATVLNAQFLYDPASLAGRKIYMGWPYFSWSAGYDTNTRNKTLQTLFAPATKKAGCRLLNKEGIDFIEIQNPTTLENIKINYLFFDSNFVKVFSDTHKNIDIYDVKRSCEKTT